MVAIIFAVSPYIATYGMALWKDPLFSAALVLFTLCLTDFIVSKGSVLRRPSFLLLVVASLLVMVFFRNNGFYIALATIVAMGALCLIWRRRGAKACFVPFMVALVGTVAVYLVVSSVIFPVIGVQPSEKVESVGIPLNQMARVAALDGEMSESDRAYLGELLPYDEYKTTYTPCCTDTLKWAPNFNGAALENDMWGHWLSMLVKNPRVYFESWELQTFGFWTVNTEQQVNWSWNISGGVPRNCDPAYVSQLDNYGIQSNPAALDAEWHNILLPYNEWSIPIGWLPWAVTYLVILLAVGGRKSLIVALVPSAALILTLVIASPFCYWPRYGAALQFLVPFLVLLFYDAITSSESSIRRFVGDDR